MFAPTTVSLLALLCLAAQEPNEKAKKLFLTNCASCHGESGDGHGTAQLDRPARSFKDGGFSFGNTPEQLFKTISVGIAGTPMAGFESSLPEDDRKLLASYVVTLGPPIEEVKVEDTILAVHDRPVVVRGMLPPLGEGLPQHPRGLLIGDPSGITFEYQADDVRLLALRQGGFVERTDWSGRGGTPLNPLGKVVTLVDGGKPEALFAQGGAALQARLSSTHVDGARVVIAYHLLAGGREVAHAEESPFVVGRKTGTGFGRHFVLLGGREAGVLELQDPTAAAPQADALSMQSDRQWLRCARKLPGASEFDELELTAPAWTRANGKLSIPLAAGQRVELELRRLPAAAWDESRKAFQADRRP